MPGSRSFLAAVALTIAWSSAWSDTGATKVADGSAKAAPGVQAQAQAPAAALGATSASAASLEAAPATAGKQGIPGDDVPTLRLPAGAKPTGYEARLTLRPDGETFDGTITIALELARPARTVWLNAIELRVKEAVFKTEAGRAIGATATPAGEDFLRVALDDEAPAGKATLRIVYSGAISSKDSSGVFRQKEGDEWYIFTQFESTDARRAFPCFDEPGYKVPWRLTIDAPRATVAVSNTQVDFEADTANGLRSYRFRTTRPLPSYLVAFAVGPFEFIDLGVAGQAKTPMRIIVPRGQRALADYTSKTAVELLVRTETYFGIPYPYDKLDFIAVPIFGGAMENAGLITYGRNLLLVAPENETIERQRRYLNIAAHEVAHQWFGDLVTMAWWDDTWLNESFASWMEYTITEPWKPEWELGLDKVQERSRAMGSDSLTSARAIRQGIASKDDIEASFDRLTYTKGTSVLSMFERWVGPENFRKGVHRYLTEHAYGNATAQDFLAAMSAEGGASLAPAFTTFIDQAGVPLVAGKLTCRADEAPKLELEQRRYLPVGSAGQAERLWQIPVCVRYDGGRTCVLMAERTMTLPLLDAKTCPAWVVLNEGESGYYRWSLPAAGAAKLVGAADSPLTPAEKIGGFDNLDALVDSGDLHAAELLELIPGLVATGDRRIVEDAVLTVSSLSQHLVPDTLKPNYQRFIRKTFGPRAKALGMRAAAGESDDQRLMRANLIQLVAVQGADPELIAQSKKLANKWIDTREGVDRDMIDVVLEVAARNGDAALFEKIRAAAKKTKDRGDRRLLLQALAGFEKPALVDKRLALVLTDEFDPREVTGAMYGYRGNEESREKAYAFMKTNYDALTERLSRRYAAYAPALAGGFCDAAHREDAEKFFGPRVAKAPGGHATLTKALERIDLCIARVKSEQDSVAAFLRKY